MSDLVVRAYNVLFGDAILVTIPDADPKSGIETERHILIDVGSVLSSRRADDGVYGIVLRDIIGRLGQRPLDLYVMTHEHLDHVKGPLYAWKRHGIALNVEYAWLTASAEGDAYYRRHAEARRRKLALDTTFRRCALRLSQQRGVSPALLAMLKNNDRISTAECVTYIKSLAKRTSYVYRDAKKARHPFKEAKLRILAPEKDASAYYPRVRSPANIGSRGLQPLPGVDPRAFRRLVRRWREGIAESIFAIDHAANNTSVVFEVEMARLAIALHRRCRIPKLDDHERQRLTQAGAVSQSGPPREPHRNARRSHLGQGPPPARASTCDSSRARFRLRGHLLGRSRRTRIGAAESALRSNRADPVDSTWQVRRSAFPRLRPHSTPTAAPAPALPDRTDIEQVCAKPRTHVQEESETGSPQK